MLIFASIMLIILGLLTYYYYYLDSTHAVTRQHEEKMEIARTVAQSIYGNWTYSNGALEITLHNPTAYPAPVTGVLVIYGDRSAQVFPLGDTVIPPASTTTLRLTGLREEPRSVVLAYNIEGVAYSSPVHVTAAAGGVTTTQPPGAAGWVEGWPCRVQITVTNNAAVDLTDYQVMVILDSNNFQGWPYLQSDGSDIRFTDSDGSTIIPHWIEVFNYAGRYAVIWVKVPRIPASGSTTIYMYYGNQGASSTSDGRAVFEFFDDFYTLDRTVWSTSSSDGVNALFTIQASTEFHDGTGLVIRTDRYRATSQYANVHTLNTWTVPASGPSYMVEARLSPRTGEDHDIELDLYTSAYAATHPNRAEGAYIHAWGWNGGDGDPSAGVWAWYYMPGNWDRTVWDNGGGKAFVAGEWFVVGIAYYGGETHYYVWRDADYSNPYAYKVYGNAYTDFRIVLGQDNGGYLPEEQEGWIDWVRVRKIVYPEPQVSLGPATCAASSNVWHYRIVLNVTSTQDRLDWPVAVYLDFTQILASLGRAGETLDVGSIRVTDDQGRLLLYNFTKDPFFDPRVSASGWLVFNAPTLRAGNNTFYIYFDTVENGVKLPPTSYYRIGVLYQGGSAASDDYYVVLTTSLEGFLPYSTGGTLLVSGDNRYVSYTLPFALELYGTEYTSLYVTTNGVMWSRASADRTNSLWELARYAGIYGYWDDLDARPGYGVYHVATFTNRLVRMDSIWWYTVFDEARDALADFVVTVAETGDIVVQYRTIQYVDGTFHAGVSAGNNVDYIYFDGNDYSWLNGRTLIYLYKHSLSVSMVSADTGSWSLG